MLDVNNIEQRLKRIYNSLSSTYEEDAYKHIVIFKDKKGNDIGWGTSPIIEDDILANFYNIIHNIASIKDHLKNKYQNVELVISNSQVLKLIIDLDNADKHGYPLKRPRSGTTPKIVNPTSYFRLEAGQTFGSITKITSLIDPKTMELKRTSEIGEIKMSGMVVFDAQIIDENGALLIGFQDLIEQSIKAWEDIIALGHSHNP